MNTRDDPWIAVILTLALVAVIFAVPSCATFRSKPTVVVPGEREAAAIIWRAYGRTDEPPRIGWRTGDSLNCQKGGRRGFRALTIGGDGCVMGATDQPGFVQVAWEGQAISDTSLAHELRHAAGLLDLVSDPLHKIAAWWEADVPRANALLREAGH